MRVTGTKNVSKMYRCVVLIIAFEKDYINKRIQSSSLALKSTTQNQSSVSKSNRQVHKRNSIYVCRQRNISRAILFLFQVSKFTYNQFLFILKPVLNRTAIVHSRDETLYQTNLLARRFYLQQLLMYILFRRLFSFFLDVKAVKKPFHSLFSISLLFQDKYLFDTDFKIIGVIIL